MLSVGGSDPHPNSTMNTTDPFIFGIKVFDLTALSWLDNFEPSDELYQEPQVIKDYYASNQRYPQRWKDNGLRDIFINSDKSNSTKVSPPASPTNPVKNGGSHTGAIAGGVSGGIVGIAALCATVWWLCTKNRKQDRKAPHDEYKDRIHELQDPPDRGKHEIGQGLLSPEGRWELSAEQKTSDSI